MGAVSLWVGVAISALNFVVIILDAIPGNQGESVLRGIIQALMNWRSER